MIGQCPYALSVGLPGGIEESSLPDLLRSTLGTQDFGGTIVHRIVIEVPHDDELCLGVVIVERVRNVLGELSGSLTIDAGGLSSITRGPVADQHVEGFTGEHSAHKQLVACAISGTEVNLRIAVGLVVGDLEELRVVEQSGLNTSPVGRGDIDHLQSHIGNLRTSYEVIADPLILHLSKTDDSRSGGGHFTPQLGNHRGNVVELFLILRLGPIVGTRGEKLVIPLIVRIVLSIKEILHIIEGYRISFILGL